ncbi:unnamed protein product (mitochondrion) [Plasmodiophora brassicae]|uniref:PHD-type domain-containing protein n=1 Tax=Plasmodiophora brassicae TaxID=37360 RepID=A0A3P3Y7C2_PLABS|nr:unnamed protein product [Plasmodiophora brassicae]
MSTVNQAALNKEMDVCGCCLDAGLAPLLTCSQCSVRVHPDCYGVTASKRSSWTCTACSAKTRTRPFCVMCRIPGGALKPTNDNRWAHICCALWTPETWVSGGNAMQPIIGVDQVHPERNRLKCIICKKMGGCIQCTSGRCATSFHVLCAYRKGLHLGLLEQSKTVVSKALCRKHMRTEIPQRNGRARATLTPTVTNHDTDDVVCDICQSGDDHDGNEIVICDGCEVAVHQSCYGVGTIPRSAWFCQPCRRNSDAVCMLCPDVGGALRQTEEGRWCHVVCALWSNMVSIGTGKSKHALVGVSSLELNRPERSCEVCRRSKGHCVRCAEPGCCSYLHVRCARSDGRRLEIRSLKKNGTRVKHLPWLDSISIANHTFTLYCEDHDDAQFSIDNVAVRPTTSPGGCDNDSDCDRGDNKSSDVESDDMPIVRRNRDSINGRSGALSDDDHVVRITRSGSNSTDGSDGQSAAHRFWDEGIAMYFDPIRPDQLAQVSVCDADECRRSDPSFILPPPISISDRDLRIDHDDLYLPSFLDVQAICHRLGLDPAAGRDEPVIHVLIATDLGHVLCQFDCGDGSRRGRARSGFRALASVNPEVGEDGDLLSELVHLQHELSLQVAELNGFRTSILHAMSDEDYASVATVTENERQQTQVDYLHVARWQSVRMALIRGVRDVDAASVGTDQDHYNTSCRVCFGTDGSELNPIVICELCGLAVHKCCYGIDTIPDDDWHCDPCANPAESRPEHECLLCPVSGFAFKPSDAGGPVHLTCALWNPIAHVADVVTMSPIAGVASAIEASAGSAKISDFYDHLALVRTDLDEVRTILDIIRRREKVKRNLYSIKVEIHEAQETVPPHGQAMEEERASTRLRKRQTTPAVEPVEVQQDVAANRPMARRGRLPKRRTEVEAETAEEAFDNKIPEAPEDHGDLENERRSTRRLTRRVSPERPASPSSVARRRSSTREVPKNGQREKPPTLTKLNGRDEQRTRRRYHALPGSPVKKRRIQSPLRADHRPVSKVKREQSNKPASSRKTDAQRLERSNQFIQILKQCDLSEKDRQRALSFVYKHRQTFKTAKPFQVDDMALASHWGPRLYDCKILEVLPEGSYRIHYHKWTSRYDEVVDASSVYRPTPEARAIQAALEEV